MLMGPMQLSHSEKLIIQLELKVEHIYLLGMNNPIYYQVSRPKA